jgi:hypothetical protein
VYTLHFPESQLPLLISLTGKNVSVRPVYLRTLFTITGVRAKKLSKCAAYIRFAKRSEMVG